MALSCQGFSSIVPGSILKCVRRHIGSLDTRCRAWRSGIGLTQPDPAAASGERKQCIAGRLGGSAFHNFSGAIAAEQLLR
jgi:hypothetical protein